MGRKESTMKRPPSEWMEKYGVTERDLEVAEAFVNGAANMEPDQVASWALAATLAYERKLLHAQLHHLSDAVLALPSADASLVRMANIARGLLPARRSSLFGCDHKPETPVSASTTSPTATAASVVGQTSVMRNLARKVRGTTRHPRAKSAARRLFERAPDAHRDNGREQ
jgi:hypothetical protein